MIDQTLIADPRQLQEMLLQQASFFNRNNSKTKYSSFEDLVGKVGIPMQGEKFDPTEFSLVRRTPKECFHNAYQLAEYNDLIYVEGYTWYLIPILHAWCIDEKGRVIDPTLDESEDYAYCGIPMDMSFVRKTMLSTGVYGIIDNWKDGFPMLDLNPNKYLHSNYKKREY